MEPCLGVLQIAVIFVFASIVGMLTAKLLAQIGNSLFT